MNGIAFLEQIRNERPTPTIVCSSFSEENSFSSVCALRAGAVDVIAKPAEHLDSSAVGKWSHKIVQAVKAADCPRTDASTKDGGGAKPNPVKHSPDVMLKRNAVTRYPCAEKIIAIGASTGGIPALEKILEVLPVDTPGILIVQHLPLQFSRILAERLNAVSSLDVVQAKDRNRIIRGSVLLAPGGCHTMLATDVDGAYVSVKSGLPVSRHIPSIDVLFRSVANHTTNNALGIILTGMGDDGVIGLREMREKGATTLAQSEASCVVYGIPGIALEQQAAMQSATLDEIINRILEFSTKNLS
jgi:two-component system chemotaxis response regulator CheB